MGLLYSNYNVENNNSLNINAVSGTLVKTYYQSYFKRFQKGSACEHFYFRENKPSRIVDSKDYEYTEYYRYEEYKLKEIVVLQIMLCADNNYLVEAIDKSIFENMFRKEE